MLTYFQQNIAPPTLQGSGGITRLSQPAMHAVDGASARHRAQRHFDLVVLQPGIPRLTVDMPDKCFIAHDVQMTADTGGGEPLAQILRETVALGIKNRD